MSFACPSEVPAIRVRPLNRGSVSADGLYVLYWMVAYRRFRANYALQHAVQHANRLSKPLVILEALRVGYRWASDRFHQFILEGMAEHAAVKLPSGVRYYPYVEMNEGDGKGLLKALASDACCVVTDEFPCFMLPAMTQAGADQCKVLCEAVDSNGILPIRAGDRSFTTAYSFRRHLHKTLRPFLETAPQPEPLTHLRATTRPTLAAQTEKRWPSSSNIAKLRLDAFAIDHQVESVSSSPGGEIPAQARCKDFLNTLPAYPNDRNNPDAGATSRLSSYLHFGHISAHQILRRLVECESWDVSKLATTTKGQRAGWWNMSEAAEAFLEQLVTWREVGFNMCATREDYDQYDSLPEWAQKTLEEHAADERAYVYNLVDLEQARTHDPLWNAAQRELVQTGGMHNYLRMLWGKKILEWTAHPREALEVMIELNNKYALDGRNPNSYSGIFWVLGRYDRAWGPERPIFGKIRYMSSDNTARKVKLKAYWRRFGEQSQLKLG